MPKFILALFDEFEIGYIIIQLTIPVNWHKEILISVSVQVNKLQK